MGTCVVGDSLVTVNNDCVVNCSDVVSCDVGDWLVIVKGVRGVNCGGDVIL